MKRLTFGISIGVLACISLALADRQGLLNAFLQSNLDGAGNMGTNFSGFELATNAVAMWPTNAPSSGACLFVNSNGTVYLLTSAPGSTAWAETNKLAP